MEFSENQTISCRVTKLYNVKPEDNIFPWYMFSLDISTTFLNYSDRSIFLVERSKLLDEKTSTSNIRDILLEMNVPVREDADEFIIHRILESAKTMAATESLKTRKILRLSVEIDVRVSLDDDGVWNVILPLPASESSIEALEKVSIDMEHKQKHNCVICLEELMIGCRGIRLPCWHLYHDSCIRIWLKCNGVCPLCRFRIVC